jgi:hypothetical protein
MFPQLLNIHQTHLILFQTSHHIPFKFNILKQLKLTIQTLLQTIMYLTHKDIIYFLMDSVVVDYIGSITLESIDLNYKKNEMKVEILYKKGNINPIVKIFEKKTL